MNDKSNDVDNKRICVTDGIFFAVVLDGTLLQMMILDGCNRLRQQQRKLKSNRENVCENNTASQLRKLTTEQLFIEEILRKTLVEIVDNGECRTLLDAVSKLHNKSTNKFMLKRNHNELRMTREDLSNELKQMCAQYELNLRTADHRIAHLKDLLEDTAINAGTRLNYTEKWLHARSQDLMLREPQTSKRLPHADHEIRVHAELTKAYEFQVKELQDTVDYWRVRYANDTARMNDQLVEMMEQLKVTRSRREELQQLYNLHEGGMRAWLTFKRERAVRRAREERARIAATRIQAWWRGVMVRRCLGSFRFLQRNVKKSAAKSKKKN